MRLSGDPLSLVLPEDATPIDVQRIRHQLGLDQPLILQYAFFMRNLARLDFGQSIRVRQGALALVLERIPATLELASVAFAFAVVIAVPVGIFAATRRESIYDTGVLVFSMIGQSAPAFFIGIMLILILSLHFGLFPTGGRGGVSSLVLPAITLGAYALASIARLTRSAMLEVLHQDYVRTARAKGLGEQLIVIRHGLRNAAIPIVTIIGIQLGVLLGGAIVTETIFSWPGIGRLAIQSIYSRDYPVVQAVVFITACWFVVINLVVDVAYGLLDPRIRYS
jgi:peptide/nickel transport system permease protein